MVQGRSCEAGGREGKWRVVVAGGVLCIGGLDRMNVLGRFSTADRNLIVNTIIWS